MTFYTIITNYIVILTHKMNFRKDKNNLFGMGFACKMMYAGIKLVSYRKEKENNHEI
jgi:hypothetical protein